MFRNPDSRRRVDGETMPENRPAKVSSVSEVWMSELAPKVPTPTINRELPFKTSGFVTLVEGLDYAAQGETGVNFYSSRGDLDLTLPYAALRERALLVARRLAGLELAHGERVAIIAETTPEFLTAFFGCQYAGLVPVPLPLCVNFGGHEAYVARLRGMMASAQARVALASDELIAQLTEAVAGTDVVWVGSHQELVALEPASGDLVGLGPEDPCYIQYSSGSTSFPRGVLVTQGAITANARAIAEHGLKLRQGDRCVSWLPLYHDMGLVGCCLTPILNQVTVDYLATSSFARRPMVWLRLMSELGGTISFAPTFGFELCARRSANGGTAGLDLSKWRLAGIGGEMIRPKALAEFASVFAAAGFDDSAFMPSYGLAEATLAVTFTEIGSGVRSDVVELGEAFERFRRAVPANGERARRSRAFAICGKPMEGYSVEIRDASGRALPERTVGRVCIAGPSLMTGYFRNPEATAAVSLADGWLDTGDMGYMVDGELVVTGRTKDLIILNGRNIWPQDLEWAIEQLEAVRAGDVAAFSVTNDDDREEVVVIVQCRTGDGEAQVQLRRDIHAVVQRTCGVDATVVIAPPRSLTFTTSGKLSRAAAKASWQSGQIVDLGHAATSMDEPEFAMAAG